MPVSQKFQFNDFSRRLKAIENIATGEAVYVVPSDLHDNFEDYADEPALQAVWVDSDAGNKMVNRAASQSVNPASQQSLQVVALAGNNSTDYADDTITSRSFSGYTVHMVALSKATSGDYEFLLASGANAATDNVKKALTFAATDTFEHVSFTVASMAADNGTFDDGAAIHVGFRCADDTGSSYLYISQLWYEKTGTTYNGIKKTVGGYEGGSTKSSYGGQCIGIAQQEITAGNTGPVTMFGPVVSGLSGLIPGFAYCLEETAGTLTWNFWGTNTTSLSGAYQGETLNIGIALSDTELVLTSQYA